MDAYGKAVIEERVRPRHLAELAAYVHHEYGPGTGVGFLFAEMANGGRQAKRARPRNGLLRALLHFARRLAVPVR